MSAINSVYNAKLAIYCPYKDKDAAKSLGAKWNNDAKTWYAPSEQVYTLLSKWHVNYKKTLTPYYKAKPKPRQKPKLIPKLEIVTVKIPSYNKICFPVATEWGPHGDNGEKWGPNYTHECCNKKSWDEKCFPCGDTWGPTGPYGAQWGSNYTGD